MRPWYNTAQDGLTWGPYVESANFKNLEYSKGKEMTTGVDQTGLTRVFPERLGREILRDRAGQGIRDHERRGGKKIGPHAGMDAAFEIAVA